jgi:hypothetical protein
MMAYRETCCRVQRRDPRMKMKTSGITLDTVVNVQFLSAKQVTSRTYPLKRQIGIEILCVVRLKLLS